MNEVLIPVAPNWYNYSIFNCAPDNTVVYGSRGDIIIINPRDPSEPADIKSILRAHSERTLGLCINHSTWNDPEKLVASYGVDKSVRLWDLNTLTTKIFHKEHENNPGAIAGISLVNDRIISVCENGIIIIYRISTNSVTKVKDLFHHKLKVTCMLSCPHASWLVAFGFSGGSICIADLRKGSILRKMRGTDHDIVGLSWCPTPYNIYTTEIGIKIENLLHRSSRRKTNEIVQKSEIKDILTDEPIQIENMEEILDTKATDEKDELLDVDVPKYDMDSRKSQSYKKPDKKNPWGDVKFDDSGSETLRTTPEEVSDFLQECTSLRNIIENKAPQESEPAKVFDESEDDKSKRIYKSAARSKFRALVEKGSSQEEAEKENIDSNLEELMKEVSLQSDTEESLVETLEVTERLIRKDPDKEYLLAAVSKNGDVNIWRALTDGRMQINLSSAGTKIKKNPNYRTHAWIAVCWVKPDILLATSQLNRVCSWNLLPDIPNDEQPIRKLLEPRIVHQDHSNQIFTITVPYQIYPDFERTSASSLDDCFIWTSARDKCIICTTIGKKRKTLALYPCFNAGINAITASPIDPTKLAIGIADSSIRVWDLSVPHTQVISMKNLINHKHDKISALDWHPVQENRLAYATSDGQVAQFVTNIKSETKFHQYHNGCVFKIQWAPLPDKQDEYALYSCSFGELIYHDGANPQAKPNKIELDEGRPHTFSWNSDFSILAVGTKEGTVKLLSKTFQVYETLYMQKKSIQCVTWHPESTHADHNSKSPYANYLAVCSNEEKILIYNCKNYKQDSGEKSSLVAVLEGHAGAVKLLAWCPVIGGRLVSADDVSVVMVWDVVLQTLISTHKYSCKENVSTLLWSPLDADLIIVGCKDHTIEIFRISKHPPEIYQPEEKKPKKKPSQKKQNISDDAGSSSECFSEEKVGKINLLSKLQNPPIEDSVITCRKILEMCDNKDIDEDTESSDDETDEKSDDQSVKNVKAETAQLFGSRKDMMNILRCEQECNMENLRWEHMHNISLWKGDMVKTIEKALKHDVIDPWLINMAPMVSHTLWSKLCVQYAEKLANEGRGYEASSYFVACHQIHKAVEALCSANMHREALALAKCRLSPEDPLINEIYDRWATYNNFVGNYERAAQCLIKLKRYSDAASLLNKRTEPKKLELALELAKRANNHDLEVAISAKLEIIHQRAQELATSAEALFGTESDVKIEVVVHPTRLEAMLAAKNEAEAELDEGSSSTLVDDEEDENVTNMIDEKETSPPKL